MKRCSFTSNTGTTMKSLSDLRRSAGGRYLRMGAGLTHLVDEGEKDRPTILLIHGATVPHWEFDHLVAHLRQAGLIGCTVRT